MADVLQSEFISTNLSASANNRDPDRNLDFSWINNVSITKDLLLIFNEDEEVTQLEGTSLNSGSREVDKDLINSENFIV